MIVKRNKQTSEEKDEKKSDIKSIAGGGLGVLGGLAALKKLSKKKKVFYKDKDLSKENEKIFYKLKNIGEDQGTAIYPAELSNGKEWDGGFYNKGRLRGPDKYLDDAGMKPGKGGDLIVTSENSDTLAHELGHSKYSKKGRASGIDGAIGRGAHKIPGVFLAGVPGLAASFLTGANVGAIEEYRKQEGKKKSKLLRHSSWAIPVVGSIPALTAEAMASRKGLKLMKEAGASKKLLKESRKNLAKSWGTYAAGTAIGAGSGEIGRLAGKHLMRWTYNRSKNKAKDTKNNYDSIKK